jgi:hypothetical protein
MVTWIGGADHVRCGGIRLPAQGVDALRWSEVQARIAIDFGTQSCPAGDLPQEIEHG